MLSERELVKSKNIYVSYIQMEHVVTNNVFVYIYTYKQITTFNEERGHTLETVMGEVYGRLWRKAKVRKMM